MSTPGTSGGFTQDWNELCTWVATLRAAGRVHTTSHGESELRLRVITAQPTVSMLPPKQQVLTWEESEKGILHSTLQADLWVTKDTNKKGDMSSQWGSQAGELFGWKPCTETHREGESPENNRGIPSSLSPSAYTAFEENHSTTLQDTHWGRARGPLPCSFPWDHQAPKGKERERNQGFTGHGRTWDRSCS